MFDIRSSAILYLAMLICATDFANCDLKPHIRTHPINLSRAGRANPKLPLKRLKLAIQVNKEYKVTRRLLNINRLKEKANTLPVVPSEFALDKKNPLVKNQRLLLRFQNRFPQATGKVKSFLEIIDKLPPTLPPTTKLNRRVTSPSEASSTLGWDMFRAGNLVSFTRNNVTFPKWMVNEGDVEPRQRLIITVPLFLNSPAAHIPTTTYPCPTFGPMWYECTRPRDLLHYPRTQSRRTCTPPRRGITLRSFNYSFYDHTRTWPTQMQFSCSSPATTTAFWRTTIDCPSVSPGLPYGRHFKFSCSFPRTTGCCTDPTSTCSEPTSTEHEMTCCTDPTSTPYVAPRYLVTSFEITEPPTERADICFLNNKFTATSKKCRSKCTKPTSTCSPPTSTAVKTTCCKKRFQPSVAPIVSLRPTQNKPKPQPFIACRCPSPKAERTTCRQAVDQGKTDRVITLTTATKGKSSCCTTKKMCSSTRCNIGCYSKPPCKLGVLNRPCCAKKKVKPCCRPKVGSCCGKENCPYKTTKCSCEHLKKAKRNIGDVKAKGDFVKLKTATVTWLAPRCSPSTAINRALSTGNSCNSALLHLSCPDSQNRTQFSMEINGERSATSLPVHLLLVGLHILLVVCYH